MWTDRRTDVTKLIVAFRNFTKSLKNAANNLNALKLLRFLNLLFRESTLSTFTWGRLTSVKVANITHQADM
jgi:hypothetical protein